MAEDETTQCAVNYRRCFGANNVTGLENRGGSAALYEYHEVRLDRWSHPLKITVPIRNVHL